MMTIDRYNNAIRYSGRDEVVLCICCQNHKSNNSMQTFLDHSRSIAAHVEATPALLELSQTTFFQPFAEEEDAALLRICRSLRLDIEQGYSNALARRMREGGHGLRSREEVMMRLQYHVSRWAGNLCLYRDSKGVTVKLANDKGPLGETRGQLVEEEHNIVAECLAANNIDTSSISADIQGLIVSTLEQSGFSRTTSQIKQHVRRHFDGEVLTIPEQRVRYTKHRHEEILGGINEAGIRDRGYAASFVGVPRSELTAFLEGHKSVTENVFHSIGYEQKLFDANRDEYIRLCGPEFYTFSKCDVCSHYGCLPIRRLDDWGNIKAKPGKKHSRCTAEEKGRYEEVHDVSDITPSTYTCTIKFVEN